MNDYGLHYWMMIGQSHLHRQIARQVCGPDGLLPGQPKILEFLARHDGCTQKTKRMQYWRCFPTWTSGPGRAWSRLGRRSF